MIEVRDGELLDTIEQAVKERSIDNAAIVTLIGAVDSFTLSTMPANDATQDVITDYELPKCRWRIKARAARPPDRTVRRSGGREPSDP